MIIEQNKSPQIDRARADAKVIAEGLIKNHSGDRISKNSIRIHFNLPNNRASLIWHILEYDYGFENAPKAVGVPEKKSELEKKIEEGGIDVSGIPDFTG